MEGNYPAPFGCGQIDLSESRYILRLQIHLPYPDMALVPGKQNRGLLQV